jgi:hypothetical protein
MRYMMASDERRSPEHVGCSEHLEKACEQHVTSALPLRAASLAACPLSSYTEKLPSLWPTAYRWQRSVLTLVAVAATTPPSKPPIEPCGGPPPALLCQMMPLCRWSCRERVRERARERVPRGRARLDRSITVARKSLCLSYQTRYEALVGGVLCCLVALTIIRRTTRHVTTSCTSHTQDAAERQIYAWA